MMLVSAGVESVLLLFLIPALVSQVALDHQLETSRLLEAPVIGILSQEYFGDFKHYKNKKSYIAASYVKWIESSGGRVVPFILNQSEEYYRNLLGRIHGFLFPGGGQYLNSSSYATSGKIIFDIIKEFNENGNFFPVWGTCLGMELMMMLESKNNILTRCSSHDQALPLEFAHNAEGLRANGIMFRDVQEEQFKEMMTYNVSINYHGWCLTQPSLANSELMKKYRVVATNTDKKGLKFVSILEGFINPFYTVQFHPEKPAFEFVNKKNNRNIPHNPPSIRTGQYFSNFFVNQCRKSKHVFDESKDTEYLIYNHMPENTAENSNYEQSYFFDLTQA
jgi:imidazoleglycerol phosphate synthase glutamine amidotransferase subunit HisH